jgi:prephenate dehydrogenase
VGAHPMFGGERGGYAASRAELWKGGTVAVSTDHAYRTALAAVSRLHRELGARVVPCSAAAHDSAVALVSHLPYLVASALALTGRGRGMLPRRLAGRGLADTTRLAAFHYDIQGEVARCNVHLAPALGAFAKNLREVLGALASSEGKARLVLGRSRLARESLFPKDSGVRQRPGWR